MVSKRIVFIDYHGVLTNGSLSSLTEPPHARFVTKQARAALRSLVGYVLVIVSNQVGVARGDFDEADLTVGIRHLRRALLEIHIRINDFLYCPHHPSACMPPFRVRCVCRKPSPWHVVRTLERFQAPPSHAAFVGDTLETDIACALSAGVLPILLSTQKPEDVPDGVLCARNVAEAALLVRRKIPLPPGNEV